MSMLFGAAALVSLAVSAVPARPDIYQATNADKVTAFRSMDECEAALGRPAAVRVRAGVEKNALRGSAFNRRAGNLSRCEMISGEAVIVVYPTGNRASVRH